MSAFGESIVEDAALAWPENAGWRVAHGQDIAPTASRSFYDHVVLQGDFVETVARNRSVHHLPADRVMT
jgi:hypothetical protein